jgi:hypothetical protein
MLSKLLRPSRPLGLYVTPFLNGPESERTGRQFIPQEIYGG